MTSERKLLDLSAYFQNSTFNSRGLTSDIAAAITEVDKTKPRSKRVYKTLMAKVGSDKVINWTVNKITDVKNFYSDKTEFDRRERETGLAIRDLLLNGDINECFAWISPPGGDYSYEEGRLEVGVVRQKMGFKILESYGIPVNLTAENAIFLHSRFSEFSEQDLTFISDPEKLRGQIVKFTPPDKIHWLNFLQLEFPELNDVWTNIKNGKVGEQNRKIRSEARVEVTKLTPHVIYASSEMDYIRFGSILEKGMMQYGHTVFSSGCGRSNSDIYNSQIKDIFGISVQINPLTNGVETKLVGKTKEKWNYHKGKCICDFHHGTRENCTVGPCSICIDCEKEFDKTDIMSQ